MKTLVVANQKGGVGKTSTLVHLAFDYYERGLKVAVIDLDTQANASFTLSDYRSPIVASSLFKDGGRISAEQLGEIDGMTMIPADGSLADLDRLELGVAGTAFRSSIDTLAKLGFDVCLIDTAPSLGVTMASALLAADYVVSPVELEAYSLQGVEKMVLTIANIRSVNKKLQFLGMIPSKVDNRNARHGRHLAELTAAYPDLIVPTPIGYRSSVADALASRVPVWAIKKTAARKAVQEVRAMAQHILDRMEIE